MDTVYKLPKTYITKDTKYPEEFLTQGEFAQACSQKHVGVRGNKLIKSKANRCKLNLILTDDKKNQSRNIFLQIKGFSTYGLSKFKGEGNYGKEKEPQGEVKVESEETKKKKSLGSWSIIFNTEENPHLQWISNLLDEQTKLLVKPHLPKIYEHFTGSEDPEDPPLFVYRKAARPSSGSTVKYFRITVYPGKVELGPMEDWDKRISLNQFPHEQPGIYQVVLNPDHIDISFEKGVITAGIILYAKIIRTELVDDAAPTTKKRKFRETDEDDEATKVAEQTSKEPKEEPKDSSKKVKENKKESTKTSDEEAQIEKETPLNMFG